MIIVSNKTLNFGKFKNYMRILYAYLNVSKRIPYTYLSVFSTYSKSLSMVLC